MQGVRQRLSLGLVAASLAVFPGAAGRKAQGQDQQPVGRPAPAVKKYQVVSPRPVGIIATALNAKGDLVGFQWAEEKDRPGVIEQRPILARGKDITYLPLLPTYTATFPAGVADDGTVVGRSSKPAPPTRRVHMRNQAFVWDAVGGIRGLGACEGDTASLATGVSRDGRRISGMSMGDNRIRACVWERVGVGGGFEATPLPHKGRLGSNTVAISGDGNHVTAVDDGAPCLWTRGADGTWTREAIGPPESLIPRAVNDAGTVVGFRHVPDGRTHPAVWTRGKGVQTLPLPPGYVTGEALAVNNAGVVAGTVDGPPGGAVGPNAFVYEDARLRLVDEGGPNFNSATALNDNGQIAGVLEEPEPHEHEPEKPAPAAGKAEGR